MNLNNFFDPKSVAVIGASNDKNKVGYALVSNLKSNSRKIFPVSISETAILGLPAYKSVSAIKDKVDLAIIAVPAPIVPGVLEACGKKEVPAAIVISSGFKEAGDAGKELEKRIRMIAASYHIALLGPNCLGTINAHAGLNASFAAGTDTDAPPLQKGSLAVLSQSGALGAAMLDWACEEGVGFSKFISLGNEAALTEIDFLEYLAKDKETKAIMLYLEKVSDGERFVALMKGITKKKPVVILKAGRSARGSAAVLSHTGSLAPEGAIFEAACRECGAATVGSLREFYNLAKLLQLGTAKPPRAIAILTNGGGPSVVAADLVELSQTLALAHLSDRTKRDLAKVLPPMAALGNPVDILGDALPPRYESALKILVGEKAAEAIILILTPQMMTDAKGTAQLIAAYGKKKLILPVFMGREAVAEGIQALHETDLVNFELPDDAIGALDALAFAKFGKKQTKEEPTTETKTPPKLSALKSAATLMDFAAARELLRKYQIEVAGQFVERKDALDAAMEMLGPGSFAMKVVSREISHKTDVGGVKLNIRNVNEAEAAWDEITKSIRHKAPHAKIQGMLVQPMVQGLEIMIGMKRDPVFGPVISFGLGGIFVEAMKDVALRTTPVNKNGAQAMMQEIKGASLLHGARGQKPVNQQALIKLIINLSELAIDHPDTQAIDLNPVIASPKGAIVVDIRIIV